jgi:hypothetical protein
VWTCDRKSSLVGGEKCPAFNIELSALLRPNGTVTLEYYFIVYRIDDGHQDIPGVLRIRTSASDLTLVEDSP